MIRRNDRFGIKARGVRFAGGPSPLPIAGSRGVQTFAVDLVAISGGRIVYLGGHSRLSFGELSGKDRAPGILCIIGELLHVKMKGSAPGCLTGVHRG
jgi:hypothetical protein